MSSLYKSFYKLSFFVNNAVIQDLFRTVIFADEDGEELDQTMDCGDLDSDADEKKPEFLEIKLSLSKNVRFKLLTDSTVKSFRVIHIADIESDAVSDKEKTAKLLDQINLLHFYYETLMEFAARTTKAIDTAVNSKESRYNDLKVRLFGSIG